MKKSDLAGDLGLQGVFPMLEGQRTFPNVVLVASATERDNTLSVAQGIAQASAVSGRRTVLVELAGAVQTNHAGYDVTALPEGVRRFEDFASSIQMLREQYDVLVLNACALLSVDTGVSAARLANAVLLAVAIGRQVVPADRELIRLLQQLDVTPLGTITTSVRQAESAAAEGSAGAVVRPPRNIVAARVSDSSVSVRA